MRKMSIVFVLVSCILAVGLPSSYLFAEDFGLIGIGWSDTLDTVKKKIDESGLASDKRWMLLHVDPVPLNSIIQDPKIDERRNRELARIAERVKKDLRIERQLKYVEFRGKSDSVIKNARFFFRFDRDILLGYSVSLNIPVANPDPRTGEGAFYQDLVKKYGTPTVLEGSRVWSRKDQSLYYTPLPGGIVVTYISDSNLSGYIDRLEGKPGRSDQAGPEEIMIH